MNRPRGLLPRAERPMTRKPQRTCPTCYLDGGWHYDEDAKPSRCPSWEAAELLEQAHALTEHNREQAREAARRIVADAAQTRREFSANELRTELGAAQIPGSVVGGAFRWAANAGLIAKTDRRVMSDEDTTRHEIPVWRSLVYGKRAGAA